MMPVMAGIGTVGFSTILGEKIKMIETPPYESMICHPFRTQTMPFPIVQTVCASCT